MFVKIMWVFPKMVGFPKSSILVGFSIINHPFWGTTILGNPHVVKDRLQPELTPGKDGQAAAAGSGFFG